jgi:hypothetical protein
MPLCDYTAALPAVGLILHLLQVTIKAADSSISRDARKDLVAGISQALPQHLQCLSGDRIYMWVQHMLYCYVICYVDSTASSGDMYAMRAIDCCWRSEQGYGLLLQQLQRRSSDHTQH